MALLGAATIDLGVGADNIRLPLSCTHYGRGRRCATRTSSGGSLPAGGVSFWGMPQQHSVRRVLHHSYELVLPTSGMRVEMIPLFLAQESG